MVIRYKKLIFVDTNDNCRAPMAEMILKRKFLTNPLTIESRGMVVLFPEPLNPKAEAVLTSNGYPQPSHIAMQLEQEDINNDVLILTMEDKQKSLIWETYENAPHVYTVKEYVGESGDIPRSAPDGIQSVLYGAGIINEKTSNKVKRRGGTVT